MSIVTSLEATPTDFYRCSYESYPEFHKNPVYPLLCLEDPSLEISCRNAWMYACYDFIKRTVTRHRGFACDVTDKPKRRAVLCWLGWYWCEMYRQYDCKVADRVRHHIRQMLLQGKPPTFQGLVARMKRTPLDGFIRDIRLFANGETLPYWILAQYDDQEKEFDVCPEIQRDRLVLQHAKLRHFLEAFSS